MLVKNMKKWVYEVQQVRELNVGLRKVAAQYLRFNTCHTCDLPLKCLWRIEIKVLSNGARTAEMSRCQGRGTPYANESR